MTYRHLMMSWFCFFFLVGRNDDSDFGSFVERRKNVLFTLFISVAYCFLFSDFWQNLDGIRIGRDSIESIHSAFVCVWIEFWTKFQSGFFAPINWFKHQNTNENWENTSKTFYDLAFLCFFLSIISFLLLFSPNFFLFMNIDVLIEPTKIKLGAHST